MNPDQTNMVLMDQVTRRFDSFIAVDQLQFSMRPGELVGLLGPNGAGKTTAVKMLMGMLRPSSGSVQIFGKDAFQERAIIQEQVGYLPDEPSFQPHLRGIELLEFVARVRGLNKEVLDAHLDSVGKALGLYEELGEFAVNLSKGNRKKLSFLLATIHRPRLLIMDEPTNGLDPVVTRAFLGTVEDLVSSGSSVLYSTHLLDQAQKICHRCLFMDQGRIVEEGPIDELRSRHSNQSLEDIFFQVTGQTITPTPEV